MIIYVQLGGLRFATVKVLHMSESDGFLEVKKTSSGASYPVVLEHLAIWRHLIFVIILLVQIQGLRGFELRP